MPGDAHETIALVGDPDYQFLQRIYQESRTRASQPRVVSTREEVEAELSLRPERYAGVFLNPKLSDPGGLPLVRSVRGLCPNTPIYLIYDGAQKQLPGPGLHGLTVRDAFRKPITFIDIENAVRLGTKAFDPKSALSLKDDEVEIVDIEFEGRDDDFAPRTFSLEKSRTSTCTCG